MKQQTCRRLPTQFGVWQTQIEVWPEECEHGHIAWFEAAKGGPPSPSPQLEETPARPPSYYCVAKCQHVPALLTGDVQGRIFRFMRPWLLFCRARRFQLMYELLIELQSSIIISLPPIFCWLFAAFVYFMLPAMFSIPRDSNYVLPFRKAMGTKILPMPAAIDPALYTWVTFNVPLHSEGCRVRSTHTFEQCSKPLLVDEYSIGDYTTQIYPVYSGLQ